ncbi:MAG: hypothetical protein O2992_10555, partial [Gemmatimonadetes bacterium]|nr:hypothetical protein [Gemmatimonadota bacterium]
MRLGDRNLLISFFASGPLVSVLCLWAVMLMSQPLVAQQEVQTSAPVVVATKLFAESYILGEMFSQLLEARGYVVDRRPGLGATEIA